MTIPREWLVYQATMTEIEEYFEEYLAYRWLPDVWWDQWRSLVNQVNCSDELWEYFGSESGPSGELFDDHHGYALVRDGEAIDFIELPQ